MLRGLRGVGWDGFDDAVLLAQGVQVPVKRGCVWHVAGIPVAVGSFVPLAHAGEERVQPVVEVGALAVAERHAQPGEDVGGATCCSLLHDGGDIFFCVLDLVAFAARITVDAGLLNAIQIII